MSAQLHPSGFKISDRPVAASFAHPYSFQPVTDFLQRDEACLMSTPALGGVEGQWVRYWDESSTVAVLEFKVEEPVASATATPHTKEKKEKKKPKSTYQSQFYTVTEVSCIDESDVRTAKSLPAQASTLPVSDKPVTLNLSKAPIKLTTSTYRNILNIAT